MESNRNILARAARLFNKTPVVEYDPDAPLRGARRPPRTLREMLEYARYVRDGDGGGAVKIRVAHETRRPTDEELENFCHAHADVRVMTEPADEGTGQILHRTEVRNDPSPMGKFLGQWTMAAPRAVRARVPLSATDVGRIKRPLGRAIILEDGGNWRGLAGMTLGIYEDLTARGIDIAIDRELDHGDINPLIDHFFLEFSALSGLPYEMMMANQINFEMESGEYADHYAVLLPVYSAHNFINEIPLLELLDACRNLSRTRKNPEYVTLPEEAHCEAKCKTKNAVGDDCVLMRTATRALRNLCVARTFERMDNRPWRNALTAARDYDFQCPLLLDHGVEWSMPVTTGKQVRDFLDAAEKLGRLRSGTDPLVKIYQDAGNDKSTFWRTFMESLCGTR